MITEYKLDPKQEFIELNKLLKRLNLVGTGGEAKIRIKSGEVLFNGEVEWQIRKKLRKGDTIQIQNQQVVIG